MKKTILVNFIALTYALVTAENATENVTAASPPGSPPPGSPPPPAPTTEGADWQAWEISLASGSGGLAVLLLLYAATMRVREENEPTDTEIGKPYGAKPYVEGKQPATRTKAPVKPEATKAPVKPEAAKIVASKTSTKAPSKMPVAGVKAGPSGAMMTAPSRPGKVQTKSADVTKKKPQTAVKTKSLEVKPKSLEVKPKSKPEIAMDTIKNGAVAVANGAAAVANGVTKAVAVKEVSVSIK